MIRTTVLMASVMLEVALLGNLWPPRPEQEPPPRPPVKQTLTGARDSDCKRDAGAGNIFGETAYARGEPDLPSMPPALARATAAARMAQDRATAISLLDDYITGDIEAVRQVARVQLSYALLRLAPNDPASEADTIRSLLTPAGRYARFTDALYIEAVLADAERRPEAAIAALDEAIGLNPRFYNAVVLRAILMMRNADASFRARGDCPALFDALAGAVAPVARLGSCPLQLAHFRLALDRELPRASGSRRRELMLAVDLALAFAARKDTQHSAMLAAFHSEPGTPVLCRDELRTYDFGNPAP